MAGRYLNLFLSAGTTSAFQNDLERYIDALLARDGLTEADIVGIGEWGTSGRPELYVVLRERIVHLSEQGWFSKRHIEIRDVGAVAAINRLSTTQEGFKGTQLTITATDGDGHEVFKIVWGLGGPDWVAPLIQRQRQQLFDVIGQAMDQLGDGPTRPSIALAASKAGAIMDWAADVVRAAGVEVTRQRVEEHANMMAGGLRLLVFLRFTVPLGIDDLSDLYPHASMPDGSPIATLDELYAHVVARVGDRAGIDRAIDEQLSSNWLSFVNGCRETYA